jgi:hypothetical protein
MFLHNFEIWKIIQEISAIFFVCKRWLIIQYISFHFNIKLYRYKTPMLLFLYFVESLRLFLIITRMIRFQHSSTIFMLMITMSIKFPRILWQFLIFNFISTHIIVTILNLELYLYTISLDVCLISDICLLLSSNNQNTFLDLGQINGSLLFFSTFNHLAQVFYHQYLIKDCIM